MMDHVAKHRHQESTGDKSKTSENIKSNQKEHVAKHENHVSSCKKKLGNFSE